jgi:hypothetical protein
MAATPGMSEAEKKHQMELDKRRRKQRDRHVLSGVESANNMVFDRDRLREITKACRPDMHEPDEQDITAILHGQNFDNACGDYIDPDPKYPECQEMVVEIRKTLEHDEDGEPSKWKSEFFNLATLIAIARTAQPMTLLEANGSLVVERALRAEIYARED